MSATLEQQPGTRRRGRPTNADLGRAPPLTQVERNWIYRNSSKPGSNPERLRAQLYARRAAREAAAQEAARVERERAEAAAERERLAAAARQPAPTDGRYYSPEEDLRLIELGGRMRDWNEIHRLMGRSSPQALKARFQKIEPIAQKAARLGREIRLRPDAKRRPCMQCRRPFDSAGHHNRLCDPCRAAEGFSVDDW